MTERELFKLAFVRELIDMGLGEPEQIEALVPALVDQLNKPLPKQAFWGALSPSSVMDFGKGVLDFAGKTRDFAWDTGRKAIGLGGLVGGTAVGLPLAGGLALGGLTGMARAKTEALDDESPDELRSEERADHYSLLADAAEARARTIAHARKQQARRAGRPVL